MSWAQREIGALLLSVENSLRVTGQSFATSVGGKQAVELDSDFFLRVGRRILQIPERGREAKAKVVESREKKRKLARNGLYPNPRKRRRKASLFKRKE